MNCNCGSTQAYDQCCGIYHTNPALVQTAEQLMRSRYCAYTLHRVDYICETTLPSERKHYNKAAILRWASESKWMGLEIIKATENTVEFKAHYLDAHLNPQTHHEKSTFKKLNGKWYFVSGISPK